MSAPTTARDARSLLRPLRGDLVSMLQALVRVDSVAVPPHGRETAAQKVLRRHLRPYRLDVEMYDTAFLERSRHPYVRRDRRYAGRHNLIARLPGSGRGRSLLLSGHVDTVPTRPNPWRDGPFSGKVRRGRLHGRGSWDMKGGLVAQFGAAMALRRAGVRLAGDLLCESVVDEEFAGGGGTLAARLRGDRADACAIAEGTNHEVVRATRGGHFFDLVCHAGDPMAYFSKEVVSPAVPVGRLLGWIDSWTGKRRAVDRGETYRHFADPAPVQVLALEANRFDPDIPWSVPLTARVRVYFQFLPHEDVPAVVAEIEASLRAFSDADPFFSLHPIEVRRLVDPPLLGHELAADHPWTRCLHGSARAVLGEGAAPLSAAEWPCDAFLNQRCFDVPTLLFGPRGGGSHNANEYVEVASVLKTAEVYLAAALEWCA